MRATQARKWRHWGWASPALLTTSTISDKNGSLSDNIHICQNMPTNQIGKVDMQKIRGMFVDIRIK